MANKHTKRCSPSYVKREMQIKTTMRYHCRHIKTAKIWNNGNTKCRPGCRTTGNLIHCQWECKMAVILEESLAVSYKTKDTLFTLFSNHLLWYLPKGVEAYVQQKPAHDT